MTEPTNLHGELTLEDLMRRNAELERMIASLTAKLERLRAWLLDLKRRCDEAMSDDNPGDTAGQGDKT